MELKALKQKTSALSNVMEAVTYFHSQTNDARMQTSTMMCFLYIALRGEVQQQELINVMMVESRTSVTRALQALGRGQLVNGKRQGGLGWIEQQEDPSNYRINLVRLTPAGAAIVRGLEKAATKYGT